MPKVFTRAVVSSSDDAAKTQSARAVLRSYYCLCGDFLLVVQGKLERLPLRKTDNSYILRANASGSVPARKFKLNAVVGDKVLVKRKEGAIELQQQFACNRCRTPIAYQSTPPPAGSGPFLYILKGSMSELQGKIPPDAFEGEDDLPQSDEQL